MASRRWWRPVLAMAPVLVAALTVAGCVAMPSAGPVQTYPVTQGPNAQIQPFVQIVSGPPRPGWSPTQIVEGFLTASASFGDNEQVARLYLTAQASREWKPTWTAIVYKQGPNPGHPVYAKAPAAKSTAKRRATPTAKAAPPQRTATVTITGKVQANLSGNGSYAVANPASAAEPSEQPSFKLVMVAGQWRISQAPQQLLLTADSFANDYQLRNLYFFDPQSRFLVPDPVYVPLQATPADVAYGLVRDLIDQPGDWLANGATETAFPSGTTLIGQVALDGVTAVVNLGGTIAHATTAVMEQVSGQLLRTISGTGQGGQAVQSIEVLRNGKPWNPPNSPDNPVQSTSSYVPASGESGTFYYLGRDGQVFSQTGARGKPVEVNKIGTKFTQIAVSPDEKYLAAVTADGDLYTGPLSGGTLTRRSGTGYASVSWDPDNHLWAATTGGQVVVLLSDGRLLPVNGPVADVTALAVAPDGVRVAMIIDNDLLQFGAISWRLGARPDEVNVQISTSPFNVQSTASFDMVTWYGPDNVITLAPGASPSVTEYPVNGGDSTVIPTVPNMQSITASANQALIAGLSKGGMMADASLTGSWVNLDEAGLAEAGRAPVYPG